jgi:hypothetical protein
MNAKTKAGPQAAGYFPPAAGEEKSVTVSTEGELYWMRVR